ncbi:MAG: hypothetical protein K6G90_11090 [Clostridia bacterium]|nr:hypothetical protein [Clostridia bacterium]
MSDHISKKFFDSIIPGTEAIRQLLPEELANKLDGFAEVLDSYIDNDNVVHIRTFSSNNENLSESDLWEIYKTEDDSLPLEVIYDN